MLVVLAAKKTKQNVYPASVIQPLAATGGYIIPILDFAKIFGINENEFIE